MTPSSQMLVASGREAARRIEVERKKNGPAQLGADRNGFVIAYKLRELAKSTEGHIVGTLFLCNRLLLFELADLAVRSGPRTNSLTNRSLRRLGYSDWMRSGPSKT